MAEAYLRYFAQDKAAIYSAGVEKHGVNPKTVVSMQEDGIDISKQTSNNIDEYKDIDFDFVITVCDNAKERCPYFPSKAIKIHQNFTDPSKVSVEKMDSEFRKVREQIKVFCADFCEQYLS